MGYAVAIYLLLRSRRRFVIWCGAMLVFGAAFLGLTFALDGRYFFQHLLVHRAYSWDTGLGSITHFYLATFQGIVLVALVWTLCRFRAQPLVASAFVLSTALAFVLVGGDGVDLNIYFNAFAAAIIVCGLAVAEVEELSVTPPPVDTAGAPSSRPPLAKGWAQAALMLALFLCVAIRVPERRHDAHLRERYLADDDAGFRAAVDLMQSKPGPALCESLLACYRADKPYTFDTYTAIEEIKSHHTDEDASLPLLRSRHFAVIQLDAQPGEAMNQPPTIYRTRSRFTPQFVDTLLENYRLVLRTSHMLIFVPK